MEKKSAGSLGVFTSVVMLAGGMIGSAIFSLSGLTIFEAGPAAIFTWIIAGFVMVCYGMIVAELSCMFPRSGGVFVFPSKALGKTEKQGKLWGWISFWGYLNANIVAIAFSAIFVGTFLGVGFPIFADMQIPLAIFSIVFCFILNILKFTLAGRINNFLIAGLIITLMIFVSIGLFGGSWDSSNLIPMFTQGVGGSLGFLRVVPIAMVGYGSVVVIAFMASEVKDPKKNIPKITMISIGIVIVIYSLVVLATIGLITAGFLLENPGMRFIPLFAAAYTALAAYPWLPQVISIAAVIALLTTILIVIAVTTRAIHATANGGLLPKKLGENAKNGTPIYATILVCFLGIIVSFFPDLAQLIIGLGALFAAVTISINCISLIQARRKVEFEAGRFRAPGGNVLPILVLLILMVSYIPDIIGGGWVLWAYTIGWYCLGLIIYSYYSRKKQEKTNETL